MAPQRELLRRVLRIYQILFAGTVLVFLFFPAGLIRIMNWFSGIICGLPELPPTVERFWLALTISLMVTLIAICHFAQRDIDQAKGYIQLILISKFTSSLFYLLFYYFSLNTLAYMIGFITDGTMLLLTLVLYLRAKY